MSHNFFHDCNVSRSRNSRNSNGKYLQHHPNNIIYFRTSCGRRLLREREYAELNNLQMMDHPSQVNLTSKINFHSKGEISEAVHHSLYRPARNDANSCQ